LDVPEKSLGECPKGLEVDSMTLWVTDIVFLIFLMPVWSRINRSIREYAESAEEHVVLDEEEIELED
jgi:hypothetical protein